MRRMKCILLGIVIGAAIGLVFALLITPAHSFRGYAFQTAIGAAIGVVAGFLISCRK